MNKITIVFSIVMLLLLSGCNPNEAIDEDDLPKGYTYLLTTENFENFYDIDYRLNYNLEGSYEVLLSVESKFDFDIKLLDVTLYIEVTENYQSTDVTEYYETQINTYSKLDYVFEREQNPLMRHAFISKFYLVLESGEVHTIDVVELKRFEYPLEFEYNETPIITIEDPIKNAENYQGFMDLIASIERTDANQMLVTTTQTTQVIQGFNTLFEQETSEMRMQNEPFYFGYTLDGVTTHMHTVGDSGDFMLYHTYPDSMQDDKYLVRPVRIDSYTMLSMIEQLGGTNEVEFSEAFFYDHEKMAFKSIFNGYAIEALLKDFMPEDAYNELVSIYAYAGLDTSILETSIVTMRLTYTNDIYVLTVSMAFNFLEPIQQTVRSTVSYTINYNPFVAPNITDENIYIMPANSVEGIIIDTDPLIETSVLISPEPHYFKVYLEAGQYLMHVDSDLVLIDVLGVDGFEGNTFFGYQNPYTWDFKNTFFIASDGYYYFVAHSNYTLDGYSFYAEKLENTAEIYEPKTLVLGDNHIDINGQYDLDYYVFDAPNDMYLEVTGDATTLLFFQSVTNKKDYIQNYYLFEFDVPRNWIYVQKGLNYLYFNHKTPLATTIHIKDYGDLPYQSSDTEQMPFISDTFLDTPMLLGSQMDDAYLRFDAQRAVYTFSYESSNDRLTASIGIYRVEDNEIIDYVYFDQGATYDLIMEPGTYYMVFNSSNYLELNIKVTKTLIEDQIIEETLEHVLTYDVQTEDIPFIEGMLIDFHHAPRHRFTLDEPATIVVGIGNFGHWLYDDLGNLLTFGHINYAYTRTLYFLEAGTYDIVAFMKSPYETFVEYKLNIALIDAPVIQDNYYLTQPMLFEDLESPMEFTTNHFYDYEVIQLEVYETTTYYISVNKTTYIYNTSRVHIESVSNAYSKNITLEPGTYYIVSSPFPVGNYRIYIYPMT